MAKAMSILHEAATGPLDMVHFLQSTMWDITNIKFSRDRQYLSIVLVLATYTVRRVEAQTPTEECKAG